MTDQEVSWQESFRLRQQTVMVSHLETAGNYLRSRQGPDGGWPIMEGLPSDVHATALAIEALSAYVDERSRVSVANGAIFLMRLKREHLDDLNLEHLSDLLLASMCEQAPDGEYIEAIVAAIQRTLNRAHSGGLELSVRSLTLTLQALLTLPAHRPPFFETWLSELKAQQSKNDGNWSALAGGPPSIVATALVVRVLANLKEDPETTVCIERAVRFLKKALDDNGWQSLGTNGDTFTRSVVLRAIANVRIVPYETIEGGAAALVSGFNRDGGCGGAPGEPSNIESTALTVLALVAAGETRFIPVRLAEAAMQSAGSLLSQVTSERDQLKVEFNRELELKSGQLLQELKDLRKQNEEFRSANRQLREEREILDREELSYRRRLAPQDLDSLVRQQRLLSRSSYIGLIAGTAIIVLGVLFYFPSVRVSASRYLPFIGGNIVFLGMVVLYFTVRGRIDLLRFLRRSIPEEASYPLRMRSDMPVGLGWQGDVDRFMRIGSMIPPSIRDELLYRVSNDLPEMPSDLMPRYARDLGLRFGFGPEETYLLRDWLEGIAILPPSERRIALDSLRRGIRT